MKATSILASVLAIALIAGCTQATAGNERPAPGLTPRPLKGETVKQALLDGATLSKILGQQFEQTPEWPSAFGGAEALQPPETVSLPDCVGVTRLMDRHPYQSANVQTVARQYWWTFVTAEAKVLRVSEGVVALPTAAEATALFGKFSAQWDKCQGQTVTIDGNPVAFSDKITDVRVK